MHAILLSLLALATPVKADVPDANMWRQLAVKDAEAALTLIEHNHPGAQPILNDRTFQEKLALARRHVEERVPQVVNYDGYSAVVAGIAADFKDGHIWANRLVNRQVVQWAGIVLARQAGQWMVAGQEKKDGDADLGGARLIACDGIAAEPWAAERVRLFRGDPTIEAQLAGSAVWLSLDDGNPFLKRPDSCTFQNGRSVAQEVKLNWRPTNIRAIEQLAERVQPRASAEMGLERFSGGYWIGLGSLGTSAIPVVAQVQEKAAELRKALMVVVDLRGNGGGNSAFSDSIAKALVGEARFQAAIPAASGCAGEYWRATRENLAALRTYRPRVAKQGQEALDNFDDLLRGLDKAVAEGRGFEPALPKCASEIADQHAPASQALPPPLMTGKLVVVIDRSCFSSCLLAVDLFKKLGATLVGEPTDV